MAKQVQGVYAIVNLDDGRVYVGCSVRIRRRAREHFTQLWTGKSGNARLQAAFNEASPKRFRFVVLEEVADMAALPSREYWWLELFARDVGVDTYNSYRPIAGEYPAPYAHKEITAGNYLDLTLPQLPPPDPNDGYGYWARPPRRVVPVAERFWENITVTEKGCWEWAAHLASRHYRSTTEGKDANGKKIDVSLHRWAYERYRGPIPAGLQLDHTCRNPPCCNPWHLEPVSVQVNVLRGESVVARNHAKTHCHKGHPLAGDNLWVNKFGRRRCRQCARDRAAKYRQKPEERSRRNTYQRKEEYRARKNARRRERYQHDPEHRQSILSGQRQARQATKVPQ